jgi:hypothetical protein
MKFVGLEVHAETIALAVAEQVAEVRWLYEIGNREESIGKPKKELGAAEDLRFVMKQGQCATVGSWRINIPAENPRGVETLQKRGTYLLRSLETHFGGDKKK